MRPLSQAFLVMSLAGSGSLLLADTVPAHQNRPYDADLFEKDKQAFFATGEFLYWLVNESTLQYAIKMNQQPPSQAQKVSAIGKYQNTDFHWSPGFRVNFGYFHAPHYWDAVAQYTYLYPSGHSQVKAPHRAGEYLNGTWPQPTLDTQTPSTPLAKASGHINLHYNLFDFLFSRRFHTNPHLRINLFGGLTAAFFSQNWKIHYTDINALTATIRNHWRFDGVGLRGGLKVDWYMGWDLYLTGLTSVGILSGWYKNTASQKTSLSQAGADYSRPVLHSTYEDHRLSSTAQISLGPSWQKCFHSLRTELVAGYEMTIWNNLQEVYRNALAFPTESKEPFINTSLLSMQGLTVRLTIDF